MSNKIKINQINVKKLFDIDYYSYNLTANENSSFMILYGMNGTGKTTILTFLYHLFNPAYQEGHRTAISKIPFKEIDVFLSNGDEILVSRSSNEEIAYTISFPYNGEQLKYIHDPGSSLMARRKNRPIYSKYCEYLRSLSLSLLYLPADREINEKIRKSLIQRNIQFHDDYVSEGEYEDYYQLTLFEVISRFNNWVHERTINLTNQGNQSIDQLYFSVVQNIIENDNKQNTLDDIKKRIDNLITQKTDYVKFGLTNDFISGAFREELDSVNKEQSEQVIKVLLPYIESLEKRLEKLAPVKEKLLTFYNSISEMFIEKEISISAENGLLIKSSTGNILDISQLSSGEKQILYLLCSIISSSNTSSLVIIDEPEISLNIKWQRGFLRLLDELIGNDNIQVILASHSFDLVTPYESSIVIMDSKNDK